MTDDPNDWRAADPGPPHHWINYWPQIVAFGVVIVIVRNWEAISRLL